MKRSQKSIQVSKAIVAILGRVQEAMSAEDIYFRMLEEDIRASISTVYCNLNRLFINDFLYVNEDERAKRYMLKTYVHKHM